MRRALALLLLAGCGGAAEVQQDAGVDSMPPPSVPYAGVASLGGGQHAACAVGGDVTANVQTKDCAGLLAAMAPIPCPSGQPAAVSCSDASGTAVTFDCGPGCTVTYVATFR